MSEELKDQINDMLDELPEPSAEEEEEVAEETPEEESVEEPVEEEEVEDAVPEEEEPEEEPAEKELSEKEPEQEPEEEEEVEEPSDDLQALRERIEFLSGELLKQGVQVDGVEASVEEPKEDKPVPAPKPLSLEELEILGDDVDFDDVLENRETFNKVMRAILGRFRDVVVQETTRTLPNVVSSQVKQVAALTKAVDEFYTENPDLKQVRKTVGAVADQIVAGNPNLKMEEVMVQAADKTRELLKMPKPKKDKVVKPSFAKPKGGGPKRKPVVKKSKLQSEIDDILDLE